MNRYSPELIAQVKQLRSQGKTYSEINKNLELHITKSTLSSWCKNCILPPEYKEKLAKIIQENILFVRTKALQKNREIRYAYFQQLRKKNLGVAQCINDMTTAKIALSMLCLGEASKYNPLTRTSFYLGSSNPHIIVIYIKLLQKCYSIDQEKLRCTVQCRADQNPEELKEYWSSVTGIPTRLFYKPLIDPRTIGKPTIKKDYKGVLRVDCFKSTIRYELETIATLVYNQLHHGPEV